jgi:predicted ArsR family transcriptional regulator
MAANVPTLPLVQDLPVRLERDLFLRCLLRELAVTLEEVVGLEEASGFISLVGQRIGEQINGEYQAAMGGCRLDREHLGDVLVDVKRRIRGDFYVIEQDAEKIILGNRACPFGDKVVGASSLCMMTSNVFGVIAAESQGYAKVVVEKAIARGDGGCRIVVYLKPTVEANSLEGREYYRG